MKHVEHTEEPQDQNQMVAELLAEIEEGRAEEEKDTKVLDLESTKKEVPTEGLDELTSRIEALREEFILLEEALKKPDGPEKSKIVTELTALLIEDKELTELQEKMKRGLDSPQWRNIVLEYILKKMNKFLKKLVSPSPADEAKNTLRGVVFGKEIAVRSWLGQSTSKFKLLPLAMMITFSGPKLLKHRWDNLRYIEQNTKPLG